MQAHHPTGGDQAAIKNTALLALWTVGWAATLALARFGPAHLWDSQTMASWGAVGLNLGAGVGWNVAHARYLRAIDELQRKIMQDALAISLGVGWVGGFAYVVAERAELVTLEADVGVLSALLGVVYMIAVAAGHLRYR